MFQNQLGPFKYILGGFRLQILDYACRFMLKAPSPKRVFLRPDPANGGKSKTSPRTASTATPSPVPAETPPLRGDPILLWVPRILAWPPHGLQNE